jgi:fatty-acyl-CoA synthase
MDTDWRWWTPGPRRYVRFMASPDTPTVTDLLLARAADDGPGLRFEDAAWSWAEHIRRAAAYAAGFTALRRPGIPFHIGILADNLPEYSFALAGAALSGAVLVGLNPTRRGPALARDVRLADCQLVLTEARHADLLAGLELDVEIFDVHSPAWQEIVAADAPLSPVPSTPDDLLMLIFTSGTSGDPKAVRCTHGKIAFPGRMLADRFGLSTSDTVYLSMPMFHSNAIMAGWSVGLAAGATLALRRRFSASGFLRDVRAFGATYANYVGRPLSYVLATPARADDADNPLVIVYGNEGAEADLARFRERFDCLVVDGFGSTEGGVSIARTPDTPAGALGKLADGTLVLDVDTGTPCPPAEFGPDGRLLNPAEAIGEIVNTAGAGWFAGYYGDPAADSSRLRDGAYHSGDLGYVDRAGFCYFAGRTGDWLRVDGENLGTAPIERILARHPSVAEVAVYGIPDPTVGDQVMAAIVARPGAALDPAAFATFLAAQPDLGPKQLPRYIRVATTLPRTATYKVVKRTLAAQGLDCDDPIWRRSGSAVEFRPLGSEVDV